MINSAKSTDVKFSALIISEIGKQAYNGLPLYNFEVTNSTKAYKLDEVVFKNQVVGKSNDVKNLAIGLNYLAKASLAEHGCLLQDSIRDLLKGIIRQEGNNWAILENSSEPNRLAANYGHEHLNKHHFTVRQNDENSFSASFYLPFYGELLRHKN